jgi:ATP-dependent DNA helicase RecG
MNTVIEKLLKERESETLEFKAGRCPLDMLGKTVCGMLNQQGGLLLWGVDDDGKASGVNQAASRATELNEFLMRSLNPRPLLSVTVHPIRDKEIIAIEVPIGSEKPYSLSRAIWVRLGSSIMRASHDQSSRLVERSAAALDRWEREPLPGFSMEDCDAKELKQAQAEIAKAGRFGIEVPEANEELLTKLYLYRNGQFSNAAVVLFARAPRAWAPNLAVRITTHTADGEATSDLMLEGPAVRMLREAVAAIQQRTGQSVAFPKGQLERVERPAYPLYALREGLVNAMVHRDYESSGVGVHVRIFPEHLVITNPGALPEGWKGSDLGRKHESRPANPDIARIFYLRELMDQLGLGAQRIIAECKSLGAKAPAWKAEKGSVTLSLFSAPAVTTSPDLSPRQQDFLKSLKSGQAFKVSDYSAIAKVSERQARRDLADLEKLSLLERHGAGPSTVYRQRR